MRQKLTVLGLILFIHLLPPTTVMASDTSQGNSKVTVTVMSGEAQLESSSGPQVSDVKPPEPIPVESTRPSGKTHSRLPKTNDTDSFKTLQLIGIYLLFLIAVYKIKRIKKENRDETI